MTESRLVLQSHLCRRQLNTEEMKMSPQNTTTEEDLKLIIEDHPNFLACVSGASLVLGLLLAVNTLWHLKVRYLQGVIIGTMQGTKYIGEYFCFLFRWQQCQEGVEFSDLSS